MAQFSLDVSKWADKARGRMDLVIRKLSLDIFSRIVLRTPVDLGRAKGNWQLSVGDIPNDTLEIDDKSGTATISRAAAEVAGVEAGDVVSIANNLPYIRALERGHSQQSPQGMVTVTLREFGAVVEDSVQETKGEMP